MTDVLPQCHDFYWISDIINAVSWRAYSIWNFRFLRGEKHPTRFLCESKHNNGDFTATYLPSVYINKFIIILWNEIYLKKLLNSIHFYFCPCYKPELGTTSIFELLRCKGIYIRFSLLEQLLSQGNF